jgi:hypothetical protein
MKTLSATFTAHYVCRTSDPSIRSAIETGSSTGSVHCLTLMGVESTTDTFLWSNGRKSRLAYVDTVRAGVSDTEGVFVAGEFKGQRLRFVGIAGVNPVSVCGSERSGSTPLYYVGGGRFGDSL